MKNKKYLNKASGSTSSPHNVCIKNGKCFMFEFLITISKFKRKIWSHSPKSDKNKKQLLLYLLSHTRYSVLFMLILIHHAMCRHCHEWDVINRYHCRRNNNSQLVERLQRRLATLMKLTTWQTFAISHIICDEEQKQKHSNFPGLDITIMSNMRHIAYQRTCRLLQIKCVVQSTIKRPCSWHWLLSVFFKSDKYQIK